MQAQLREIPGPPRWPVLGNPGALLGLLPFFNRQHREHGDVFRMKVMAMAMIATSSPDFVQQVLLTQRHKYVKGAIYDGTRELFGDSLLTLEADVWKDRRALAQPAFHRRSLEQLTKIMVDTGAKFLDDLRATLPLHGGVVDIGHHMPRLTLEVVVRALFGTHTFSESDSTDHVRKALALMSERANSVPLPSWIPRPSTLRFKRAVHELDTSVYRIIAAARAQPQDDGSLLSMLLATRDQDGQALSERALRDEVITMFIAGHETSALTMTWLFALLDEHPEHVAHIRDEVERVLNGREPTFRDISELVFTRQVIDEALRMRPPVPTIARNVIEEDEFAGYHIRVGDVVVPNMFGLHHHPDHWEHPARFDPQRFAPGSNKTRHPWAYMPFSGGPRTCIGNTFALTELAIIVAQMFTRFEIEVQSCADVKPVIVITTRPSGPVRVKLTPH